VNYIEISAMNENRARKEDEESQGNQDATMLGFK
jgi:hypothetical protein